jgi:C-terminal processing protease CtpA/Prc
MMQKLLTAGLVVLVLFLLAANSRLEDRRAALERRLEALERRPQPRIAMALPQPPAVEIPAPPPAAAAVPTTPAVRPDTPKALRNVTVRLPSKDVADLTTEQMVTIEELRRVQANLGRPYREELQALEDRIEAGIREVLTPEQREKYDAQGRILDVQFALAQEAAMPEGVKPGYLGVSGTDAASGGVELQQVFPGTVAHRAGLQTGDVLVDIDGEKLAGYSALAEKIRASGEGKPMSLRVRRAGVEFLLGVQLGARP